jgi:hypothetical protein
VKYFIAGGSKTTEIRASIAAGSASIFANLCRGLTPLELIVPGGLPAREQLSRYR